MPAPSVPPTPFADAEALRHLRVLAAEPRPAGSAAERRARAHCTQALVAAGLAVREEPFEYSALPGRWATPVCGVLSMLALAVAGHLGYRLGMPRVALGVLAVVGVAIALGASWLAREGVVRLRWLRARGVNLVAQRGLPTVWLVAHLDSKSQPVPIAARAAGIVGTVAAWLAAVVVAAVQPEAPGAAAWWPWVSGLGVLAGIPVAASVVGAQSAGALDNASGVAAVLLAAGAVSRAQPLGVLLTSAEELGLAGARAWAQGQGRGGAAPAPAVAINCDGVDDRGGLTCMYTGRAPGDLVEAVRAAAAEAGVVVRVRRLLPGILVDAVALADAGWSAVTISKGTLGTLARIHRPADVVGEASGAGIAAAARLIHGAASELR